MTEDELKALELQLFGFASVIDTDPSRVVADLPGLVQGVYGQASLTLDSERAAFLVMQSAGVLIDAAVLERETACLWLADAWLSGVLDSYQLDEKPEAVSEALYFRGNARIAIADLHTDDKMRAVPPEQWPSCRTGGRCCFRVARIDSVGCGAGGVRVRPGPRVTLAGRPVGEK